MASKSCIIGSIWPFFYYAYKLPTHQKSVRSVRYLELLALDKKSKEEKKIHEILQTITMKT